MRFYIHRMCCVFFFKQKTAYEMRISDWSSDVCSSDLRAHVVDASEDVGILDDDAACLLVDRGGERRPVGACLQAGIAVDQAVAGIFRHRPRDAAIMGMKQIGRASCRERVCQYV